MMKRIIIYSLLVIFLIAGIYYIAIEKKSPFGLSIGTIRREEFAETKNMILDQLMILKSKSGGTDYIKGEILIKFQPSKSAEAFLSRQIRSGQWRVKKVFNIKTDLTTETIYYVKLVKNQDVIRTVIKLNRRSDVAFAEPNYTRESCSFEPDDTYFSSLWGLHNTGQEVRGISGNPGSDIDALEAWSLIRDMAEEVIVAVIDRGVDYNHEDLKDNIWINTDEIPSNGRDDDGNGYVDDYYGYNFYVNDSDPSGDLDFYKKGHGTRVAGVIGARGNNGIGVTGVSWNVKLMVLQASSMFHRINTASASEAILYAINNGARIINCSYGHYTYSVTETLVIARAGLAGVLVIAGAGNNASDNDDNPFYPANLGYRNIIAVAATDQFDELADFSNYGLESVDLAAPGKNILSTYPGNRYRSGSGTSYSAPYVSGVCALVWGNRPELGYREVKDIILNSVDPLPALEDKVKTGGRLNAYNALLSAVPELTAPALFFAVPGVDHVILTWYDNPDPYVTGYVVVREEQGIVPIIESFNTTLSNYRDDNVVNGVTYTYKVAARDSAGRTGAFSREITVMIP